MAARPHANPVDCEFLFRWAQIMAAFVLAGALPARGDLFHLRDGSVVDGKVVGEGRDIVKVKTAQGVVTVQRSQIERREALPPPWERYVDEKKKHPDTADGHFELAMWCRKHGMTKQMKDELKRTIELDPDHADARRELGFVRKNDRWVKSRTAAGPGRPGAVGDDEDRLARQIITSWFIKVRAIRTGRLDGPDRDELHPLFIEGRKQILAIKDPLALPALAGILSGGSESTRTLLVEALSKFPQDEATMNLLVVALFDPSPQIRRAAAVELIPRKDERVVMRLIDALASDEEQVLRNAATALGVLKAEQAVEPLIPRLEYKTRGPVSVPRNVYFDDVFRDFRRPTIIVIDGRQVVHVPYEICALGPGSVIGTYWTTEIQTISVYRTEVQEALIAITGTNFGFDANAWRAWWRTEHPAGR